MFPLTHVRKVFLFGVCLTLKRYVPVGGVPVQIPDEPQQPFDGIDDVVRNVQKFLHLRRVYLLVIDDYAGDLLAVTAKKKAEKVYCHISLRRK